ncbi:MAG: bifunctional 2-C-methyl-D-erythritol 4-phosphate cytidylyltransferase/2-C-methyl-D-erythritol 2,4-cyclodiphosphate synthase [Rhodospirillaceae bacterium]|nr:bifunctional 2-C-methyl-D-erythritol 4-phosphate cytidylyltransferase/2-C-methyl-D-erythritol 2,4-cyclodiphosphate synthase [Rhodospirillaceae bacterium]|tara:strand:+ start:23073 stop:24233 length:1161 start_codon:yes stop_codon:yes gene_type:complete
MTGCIALILSGGSGSRYGEEIPKQYMSLGDRPVIRHAVERFLVNDIIDGIRIVRRPQDQALYDEIFSDLPILEPVDGGNTRQESVRLGLESLTDINPSKILIHDGARPFPDPEMISQIIETLKDHKAVIPALPVFDTIKQTREDKKTVSKTLDRRTLWRAQTPQAFEFDAILSAHKSAIGLDLTDDSMVAENAGISVKIIQGNETNLKITTQEDMQQARMMLGIKRSTTRIGTGFDVHRFGQGDHVMLCGINVPHDQGLDGHSDADVPMHALTDALLGAIADGDIGSHFPPTDEKWKNAESTQFLRHAADLVANLDGEIVNVDVTIICELPKVGPHRDTMRQKISEILEIPLSSVSIKATTTERLGFTGRSEGIAAQASASISLPS